MILTQKELPERRAFDFYPTDRATVEKALCLLATAPEFRRAPRTLLDPGAGEGIWGRVAREVWPLARITGVELRDAPVPAGYGFWHTGDFPQWAAEQAREGRTFDLVVGNPPYGKGLAEEFVRRGLELLAPGGRLMYLLRMSFNEGQKRRDGLFREHPMVACYSLAKRPSFTGDGRSNATHYGLFLWKQGWQGPTCLHHV